MEIQRGNKINIVLWKIKIRDFSRNNDGNNIIPEMT
jgi:hypothetical protein